jgi:multicomponent Na+:H+ antiporter subunit D
MYFSTGWFLFIPLFAVLLMPWISLLGRRFADALALTAQAMLLALSIQFLASENKIVIFQWAGINLRMDALSHLFLIIVNTVAFFSLMFSIDYIEHYGGRAKFYSLFLLMVCGMNGMLMVSDLFSLYLFLEVTSVASYVLVAFNLKFDGIESALKYLLLSAVATGLILFGTGIILMHTGTIDFNSLRIFLERSSSSDYVFLLAGAMFVSGFGLKAAVMPFHAWLPDAHPSAPAPISAMLSGVVIKVTGIYAIIRLFFFVYPAPPQILTLLLIFGILSMSAGSIIAFFQNDFKRMLAYSSISQIGYILIGLGIGNTLSMAGALFHVYNHALFKSLLFLNSGAVQFRTGTRDLREMGGLGERMKVTSITGIFGTLSIAGVPPFNGFFSKFFIILGAVMAKQYVIAGLLVAFSIFTLGYFLIIQRRAFFGKLNERWREIKEVPFSMALAMIFLAAQCLLAGVFFHEITVRVIEPAVMILHGGR